MRLAMLDDAGLAGTCVRMACPGRNLQLPEVRRSVKKGLDNRGNPRRNCAARRPLCAELGDGYIFLLIHHQLPACFLFHLQPPGPQVARLLPCKVSSFWPRRTVLPKHKPVRCLHPQRRALLRLLTYYCALRGASSPSHLSITSCYPNFQILEQPLGLVFMGAPLSRGNMCEQHVSPPVPDDWGCLCLLHSLCPQEGVIEHDLWDSLLSLSISLLRWCLSCARNGTQAEHTTGKVCAWRGVMSVGLLPPPVQGVLGPSESWASFLPH